ncbi:FUSC family protein [Microbacterium jejuense]|uniref:FUSC family protein n=1 Tax=Microbacterium jejuense TaxID=1263637 RepID=A0ABS7HPC4_9MICO|nr:FUSC family protein [Microbacterium jejuense]MBW9094091.1 FUSC family protein [Microbacterium jejuense]
MTAERTPPLRRAVSYTARLANQPRVLLAVKTSLAAVLAWYLAPLIPFTEDQYSYYAPLGALVTMHPTIARSARVGGQVLMGLALGIGVSLCGIAALHLGVPGGVVLGIVIGVGVLLGGLRWLGAGGDWVALAALFVLLAAGGDPEGFSISYLGTTAFGVLVGIAVNLLIVPPLYLRRASERLSALRDTVTDVLTDVADAVARDEIDAERMTRALQTLDETGAAVAGDVDEAEESARANPRRRRHQHVREQNARRMPALERTAFLTRDLIDLLIELHATDDGTLASAVRDELAEAIRRAADLVAAPVGDARAPERLRAADDALGAYQRALGDPRPGHRADVATGAAVELCLRRIIDVSRPFV